MSDQAHSTQGVNCAFSIIRSRSPLVMGVIVLSLELAPISDDSNAENSDDVDEDGTIANTASAEDGSTCSRVSTLRPINPQRPPQFSPMTARSTSTTDSSFLFKSTYFKIASN